MRDDPLARTKERLAEQGRRNPGATMFEGHPGVDIARIVAEVEHLRDLARATLLFLSEDAWKLAMAEEWQRLMGPAPVTNETLAKALQKALGDAA